MISFVHRARGLTVVLPLAVAMSAPLLWRDGTPRTRSETSTVATCEVEVETNAIVPRAPTELRCRVVRAEDGQAIANALVELMQDHLCAATPEPVCAAEATDADGWVRFDAAPSRSRLRVFAAGYAPETGAVFEAGSGYVEQVIALSRETARRR